MPVLVILIFVGYTFSMVNSPEKMKLFGRIKKELLDVLPAFIFFLVMFNIVMVTKMLTLKAYGISVHSTAIAAIGALIVAKAILIANKLPFLNIYPGKPLVWNVVLKTIAFSGITFLFLIIEELLRQGHIYGSIAAGYTHLKTDIVWPSFWAREIWITTLIIFYCACAEFIHIIGANEVWSKFFGRKKS